MRRLLAAATSAIDSIRINDISNEMRDGRSVWVKRRRRCSQQIAHCANLFFRCADNPVYVWGEVNHWQQWEVSCFRLLNGDGFVAFVDGPRAVGTEKLPGASLSEHLDAGLLTINMLVAAANEFRRAHQLWCPELGGPWSHGDPHMANFLYDESADRARLIDFEVVHRKCLSPDERHANDLLVFLQDMVGRLSDEQWLPFALSFLRAYETPTVITALKRRLLIGPGLARIWWAIRTRYMNSAKLRRRIDDLRSSL